MRRRGRRRAALLLRANDQEWEADTRIVLFGTFLLGISGGVVGTFMLLRKRSLVGDVVGHAALPGIALAYLVMEIIEPGSGQRQSASRLSS